MSERAQSQTVTQPNVEEGDIGVVSPDSDLLGCDYFAAQIEEVIDGRAAYPFVFTEKTHTAVEDFEVVVKPHDPEYDELAEQINEAEENDRLLQLSERDVKRMVSA